MGTKTADNPGICASILLEILNPGKIWDKMQRNIPKWKSKLANNPGCAPYLFGILNLWKTVKIIPRNIPKWGPKLPNWGKIHT